MTGEGEDLIKLLCAILCDHIPPFHSQFVSRMLAVIESRLKATEKQYGSVGMPRVIRLSRKFKFTENETKIAVYSLVAQSGYDREGRYSYGSDVLSTCHILDIPLQEILDFLDKDRLHMTQGFFPEIQDSYILSCSITYDSDFCKALMGSQLKSNEFLKLEQTYLADVIAEEPGNEHYRYITSEELYFYYRYQTIVMDLC